MGRAGEKLSLIHIFRKVITISNPLGEDYSIMRTTTLNGMLSSLATNYNRRNKAVRLYEIGKVYLPKALPLTELPDERTHFTLGMYGAGDFFDMKGVICLLYTSDMRSMDAFSGQRSEEAETALHSPDLHLTVRK